MGYVQGMSFLTAVLLLNMDPPDAFVSLSNLLHQPCQRAFFRMDADMVRPPFLGLVIYIVQELFFQVFCDIFLILTIHCFRCLCILTCLICSLRKLCPLSSTSSLTSTSTLTSTLSDGGLLSQINPLPRGIVYCIMMLSFFSHL